MNGEGLFVDQVVAGDGRVPPQTEQAVLPTAKYTAYLNEVEAALALQPGPRTRRRYEFERGLLHRARFIELNGVVHHYQDVGPHDGEPLILVHGWDCSSFWWHHIVDPLAMAGYRVISYDLKGHGFSDNDPHQNYSIESFSADLHALASVLELERHHVAAFSLGAFIALQYAYDAAERVRSLAFFNFGLLPYNRFISALVPPVLDTIFNRVLRPLERRNLWIIPFIYARLVLARNTPPLNDIRLGTLSVRCCAPEAVRVSARQLARREVLANVSCQMSALPQPTLLVAGRNDPVMQPAAGRALMKLARNGIYLEIPHCGHLILFELPEQVVQILRMYLRGVDHAEQR